MNNRTIISASTFKVPFTVWKEGGAHPYAGMHLPHRFVKPAGKNIQYVTRKTEGTIYNEWIRKGVAMPEGNGLLISVDIQHDDHIVSIPVDLGLMKVPLTELAKSNTGYSFGGACGMAVAKLFLDTAYSTDILQEKGLPGNLLGPGLRIAQITLSMQQSISRDFQDELGYKHILSWTQILHIYTRIALMESLGRLDEYKGIKGMIKMAREAQITNLAQVRSHAQVMGIADELGYLSLYISIAEIIKYDIDVISGLLEKAIKNEINVASFMYRIRGMSQEEASTHMDRSINERKSSIEAKEREKQEKLDEAKARQQEIEAAKKRKMIEAQEKSKLSRNLKSLNKEQLALFEAKLRAVRIRSSRVKASNDPETQFLKRTPAPKPSSVTGARKDSAEEYYYEFRRWCREYNFNVDMTLPQFQSKWEGRPRKDWDPAFEKIKKEFTAKRKKRLSGK